MTSSSGVHIQGTETGRPAVQERSRDWPRDRLTVRPAADRESRGADPSSGVGVRRFRTRAWRRHRSAMGEGLSAPAAHEPGSELWRVRIGGAER